MTLDFTVAIPTYNGAERLPRVLEKLRSQVGAEHLTWEVIIVDNNSTDHTAQVIQNYQKHWPAHIPLRYCFEAQQGAAFARQHAVREAKGQWVAFLDDDNLPASDWLQAADQFSQSRSNLGAFSGLIHGEFEVKPPKGFEQIQGFLAIRNHGTHPKQYAAADLQLPPAASLIVLRQAWLANVPSKPALTGKRPNRFIQGDDYEPLLYIHKAGFEIWYTPTLQSHHQIPKNRLEKSYLLMLARGCGLATCQLCMINAKSWQKPFIFIRLLLGSTKRIISHWFKHRDQLNHELSCDFEMSFHLGSLESPFYWLKGILQPE